MTETVTRTLCRVCIRKLMQRGIAVKRLTGFDDVFGKCDNCHRGADSCRASHAPVDASSTWLIPGVL